VQRESKVHHTILGEPMQPSS